MPRLSVDNLGILYCDRKKFKLLINTNCVSICSIKILVNASKVEFTESSDSLNSLVSISRISNYRTV